MILLTRRRFIQLALAGAIAICIGCEGTITPLHDVKEYAVELVTSTGEMITEKAGALADALKNLWGKLFAEWDGNVEVAPDNRLKGIHRGTYQMSVMIKSEGSSGDKMTLSLTDPPVFRRSVDSPWEVDPSAFPPGFLEQ